MTTNNNDFELPALISHEELMKRTGLDIRPKPLEVEVRREPERIAKKSGLPGAILGTFFIFLGAAALSNFEEERKKERYESLPKQFSKYDTNKDGLFSTRELIILLNHEQRAQYESFPEQFRKYDTNRDNLYNQEELNLLLRDRGIK